MNRLHRIAIKVKQGQDDYNDHGHYLPGEFDEENWPVLWIWDGQLRQTLVTNEDEDLEHVGVWPESEYRFRGRYDPLTSVVTLLPPVNSNHQFRPPPPVLIKALKGAFPNANEIRTYDFH